MGIKSRSFLKNENRDFNNVLDSFLSLARSDSDEIEGSVNHGIKSIGRYYLEEYFNKVPKLNNYLEGSTTVDLGSIADGNEQAVDVTVTGAALGDFVIATHTLDVTDLTITATVTSANTVTVIVGNFTGGAIDLGSGDLNVKVVESGMSVSNENFEVLGTNMTNALSARHTTRAGIKLTTAGADQDQAILAPHLDAGATAWTGTKWGTENYTEWECMINLPAIDNQKVWAGLKLTNDQLVATDADQAYFKFQTDATNSEAFTDFTVWHFIYSVGGTDYITALPITVAATTDYHLKIKIDSDRKVSIFVNGVQYGLASTAGSTGGTTQSDNTARSLALTDDKDLIPYIGIEGGAGAAEAIDIAYCAINRILFE